MRDEEIYQTRGYRGLHQAPPRQHRILAAVIDILLFAGLVVAGLVVLALVFLIPFAAAYFFWGPAWLGH